MGDPNRDPNRVPPPAPPPANRTAPDADPVDATVGPVLGTVSGARPIAPGPGGTSTGIVWDANRPFQSYNERQSFTGPDGAGLRLGGSLSTPGVAEQRLFIGTAVGGTSLGFAGDQATGAFAFGLRQHNDSNGLALGYALNPQTRTQAGFLRLDVDNLQVTGTGSIAPAGGQFGLDANLRLQGDRTITGNGSYNLGTGEGRVGAGYNGGADGIRANGAVIFNPQGVGGTGSISTQLGETGSGFRLGAQGTLQPGGQIWNFGPNLEAQRNNWNITLGADYGRDAQQRLGANFRAGAGYTDPNNSMRFNLEGSVDTRGTANLRGSAGYTERNNGMRWGVEGNVDTRGDWAARGTLNIPFDTILGGGRRSSPGPRGGGLTEPPPLRDLPGHSALEPTPGSDAALPRTASASDTNALLEGLIARQPGAMAAARNHPEAQAMVAGARDEANRLEAARAPTPAAPTAEQAPEQANPTRGARALG
ncbi:hypothetical protein ABIE09_004706 [Lysobacter enzymogenes]|uniref:hypothetical protein n=1 Tax=Lysobacter enzymogenes TaxID=69 RepID=UPI00339AC2E0